jgi:glucose-6-phosphate isomerase
MLELINNEQLKQLFNSIKNTRMIDLFVNDKNRYFDYKIELDGFLFDYSKNLITKDVINKFIEFANQNNFYNKIKDMFSGKHINFTEDRAVLHTLLRGNIVGDQLDLQYQVIQSVYLRMKNFADKLHNHQYKGYTGKAFTDIVNIGIGGSDLGPQFVTSALKPYRKNNLNIHFISSVDGYQLQDLLDRINPETTLFIIASKTFTTQETMTNAQTIKKWFLAKMSDNLAINQHFVAVSTNLNKVEEFGILANNMFEFWDFVGGRYSICSSIGLSTMLYIGSDNFSQLLDGANQMDQHFYNTTDLSNNMPFILAIIGLWYINFFGYQNLVISPYNTRLSLFVNYIQQLEMESNGKTIDKNGDKVNYQTCPIIWGGSGINGQHAYYQLIHQGSQLCPMDIILSLKDSHSIQSHHDILVANTFAQAQALMVGKNYNDTYNELVSSSNIKDKNQLEYLAKHKVFQGNRPTNMLVLPEITPYYLGMLIALYEHKVFIQGLFWNINSFDQMGVELGKKIANQILVDIVSNNKDLLYDNSTNYLIKHYQNSKL